MITLSNRLLTRNRTFYQQNDTIRTPVNANSRVIFTSLHRVVNQVLFYSVFYSVFLRIPGILLVCLPGYFLTITNLSFIEFP